MSYDREEWVPAMWSKGGTEQSKPVIIREVQWRRHDGSIEFRVKNDDDITYGDKIYKGRRGWFWGVEDSNNNNRNRNTSNTNNNRKRNRKRNRNRNTNNNRNRNTNNNRNRNTNNTNNSNITVITPPKKKRKINSSSAEAIYDNNNDDYDELKEEIDELTQAFVLINCELMQETQQKSELQKQVDKMNGNISELNKMDLDGLDELEKKLNHSLSGVKRRRQNIYENKFLCLTCLERPKNVVIQPCNHFILCGECMPKLKSNKCPACQQPIDGVIKVKC
eukprot:271806_1